jgi:universal stress protein A
LLTISWEWFASTVKMAPRGPAKDAQHLPTEAQRTFPELVRIAKMTKPATDRAEISIKKILAPTDFSPPSRKALHYALRFAEEFGSEVILLHVLEPVMPLTFEGLTMPSPAAEIESSDAAKSLKALVASARARGIAGVRAIFRRGFASHEIVEAAKDLDVDLILIATHGYTGWKHFCIGSTAERVVRAAPCPVLVVREKEHDFL